MTKIVTTPNPVLSGKAQTVKNIDKEIKQIIADMIVALNSASDPIGVGLAAPQIGIPLRIFITKPTISSDIKIFINPKFIDSKEKNISEALPEPKITTKSKKEKEVKLEGCLSLPNIWGEVKRKPIVTLTYMDEHGKQITKTFRGLMATIVQHEMDHLDGVLFPKHVLEQKSVLYKSVKDEKGQDIFEEIKI